MAMRPCTVRGGLGRKIGAQGLVPLQFGCSPAALRYQFPRKSAKILARGEHQGKAPGQSLSLPATVGGGGLRVALPVPATTPSEVIREFDPCR